MAVCCALCWLPSVQAAGVALGVVSELVRSVAV